jgi:hypothetical protein
LQQLINCNLPWINADRRLFLHGIPALQENTYGSGDNVHPIDTV